MPKIGNKDLLVFYESYARDYPELFNVSDIPTVLERANKIYQRPVYRSKMKNKKYSIEDNDGNIINFGDIRYEDWTKHRDSKRKKAYLGRATKMRGDWKNNPFSANNLSINLLW